MLFFTKSVGIDKCLSGKHLRSSAGPPCGWWTRQLAGTGETLAIVTARQVRNFGKSTFFGGV